MTPRGRGQLKNYRESHVGRGQDYHDKFIHGPYRSLVWELEQTRLLEILGRHPAGQSAGLRLLDFACGTGRVLQLLESRVASSTGIDVSQSMLDVARSHLSRTELLLADITREPVLLDRRFDLITAFRFFPNSEPALRNEVMGELVNRLSESGILILNNHLRCEGTKMRLRLALRRFFGRGKDKVFHCMSDKEVVALVERFDLAILEEHHLAILPILKEKRPLIPKSILRWIENAAVQIPAFAPFANLKIYVLGHRTREHDEPAELRK